MIHDFAVVWRERDLLISGLENTVALSLASTSAALVLGALLAIVLMSQRVGCRLAAAGLVDALRCIPFLLFAYIVYYGLPSLGINLDNWKAGLAALTIYNTAYMAEILRGVWAAQPREPLDAGYAFGFIGLRHFRRIVLPPLLLSAAPLVGNQVIQVIKDSAFLTVIALPELTHAASSIQSRHYIPFAAFITAVLLYWLLCLLVEVCVASAGSAAEARR